MKTSISMPRVMETSPEQSTDRLALIRNRHQRYLNHELHQLMLMETATAKPVDFDSNLGGETDVIC